MDWSRKFKRCTLCKGDERHHRSKGLCTRCYERVKTKKDNFAYREYRVPPLMTHEVAYIAGLLDGEGCIGIYSYKNGCKKANLQICNTYKPVIEWIHNKMACGSIHARSKKATGFKSNKQCYNWSVMSQQQILEVLKELEPFLQIKKEKAIEIIGFISNHPDKRLRSAPCL